MSQSPGMSVFPPTSITSASRGTVTVPVAPTAVMRFPVTITVVRGRIFPDSASNRFAFVNAVGRAGTLMIFLARSAPRAESYAAWTLRSAGTADSKP